MAKRTKKRGTRGRLRDMGSGALRKLVIRHESELRWIDDELASARVAALANPDRGLTAPEVGRLLERIHNREGMPRTVVGGEGGGRG